MKWMRLAATLIGAAWLIWLSATYGLSASALGRGDARTALALRPHSAEALSLASEQALARNDYPAAERLARSALVLVPRDVRALRVMGIAVSLQGNNRLGSELLLRSGILSWRDVATQVWLIRAAMDQQNYATAAQRLDAMLRSGQLNGDMLQLAHAFAMSPEGRAALIERLVEAPPWRNAFFSSMETLPRESEAGHILLIAELRAREGPLPRSELVGFVRRLVDQGDAKVARQVWYGTLTADGRNMVSGVFDGEFRIDPTVDTDQPRYVFEWDLESGGGALASIGTPPMLLGETALNIRAGDTDQRVAGQTIVLDPGIHRLSYATAGGDASAISWRASCVGHNRNLPMTPVTARTVAEWRTAELSFEVPKDCPAQRLEIVARAGGPASSEIWLDHVSVK